MQQNYGRHAKARQAAMAGVSCALRKMSDPSWAGVGVNLNANLGGNMAYNVVFQTGDPSLTPADPDYADFPYRVTLTSTGTAHAAGDPNLQSQHTVQAVVQLVPRKLNDPPGGWPDLSQYTVCQWASGSGREMEIEVPARIEGPVRCNAQIRLCDDYPGDGDDRPFAGTIDEVAIFGKALSREQIEDLHDQEITLAALTSQGSLNPVAWWRLDEAAGARVATDSVGNNHGLYDGAAAQATPHPDHGGTGAARFDGFNDQIFLKNMNVGGGQMTILAWFQVDSFNNTDARIISKATGTSNSSHYWMLSTVLDNGHRRLRFRLKTDEGDTKTLIAASGNISAGQWVFAAAVYDGQEMILYMDGEEVGDTDKEGSLVTNSTVPVAIGNNPPGSARGRLLRDLEALRVAGQPDQRPLTGPIDTPRSLTSGETLSLLENDLQVIVNDVPLMTAPATHPGQVTSYRLYPGGKVYQAQALSSSLANATFEPDPVNNPLGVFTHPTNLYVNNNVTIRGTVIAYDPGTLGDIEILGDGVTISGVNLPALHGDSSTYQLPAAIARDDIRIHENSSGSLNGLALTWDDFEFASGTVGTDFMVNGQLVVADLEILSRTQWDYWSGWWLDRVETFLGTISFSSPVKYFPTWLKNTQGLDAQPRITIRPDPAGVKYHWHDWSQPLFVPHPDDGGLRWDLIDWRDNP